MEITEKASHYVHDVADKIANASNQAAETLEEKGEQLINAEQRLMKNCQGYVRTNPVTSLAIAAAAGFLLSRLMIGR